MIRRDRISVIEFQNSYSIGIDILSVCLNQFDFSERNDQYLFEIINSFICAQEMTLIGAVQGELLKDMSNISAMKVDEAVN